MTWLAAVNANEPAAADLLDEEKKENLGEGDAADVDMLPATYYMAEIVFVWKGQTVVPEIRLFARPAALAPEAESFLVLFRFSSRPRCLGSESERQRSWVCARICSAQP